jgi:beta-galactosidase
VIDVGEGKRARFADGALWLGETRVPLRCGSVQYFRLARDAFRPALEAARASGVTMVETYVPWGVHERAPGQLDFGDLRPENDLGAFLDLAHELGLFVFLRPGPHINAELTYFGLPERIVTDEACWARSPRDTPVYLHVPPRMFPVPSFASHRFQEEAERWLAAVADVVRSRVFPDGPVALVQLDNEPSLWFRNGAYDQDYHPDAQAKWRRFLRDRHGSLDALRAAHGVDYASFEHAEPPRRFDEDPRHLARHLDWARFQESLVEGALRRFAAVLRENGLGALPTVINLPIGENGIPVSLGALSSTADLVGFDYYHGEDDLEIVARRTRLLSGTSDLPFAPEIGVGSPPWFFPISAEASLETILTALAFGLRGLNLYMLVGRDRWIGAPIDEHGEALPTLEPIRRLMRALEATRFESLRRPIEAAIVLPQEYQRLSRVTQLLGIFGAQIFDVLAGDPVFGCRTDALGFAEPVQLRWWEDVVALSAALERHGVPFDLVSSEMPVEHLARYRLLFSPSYELCAEERWTKLRGAAKAGSAVYVGPLEPSVDDRGRRFEPARSPGITVIPAGQEGWADALCATWIEAHGAKRPYPVSPAPMKAVSHEDDEGTRVLFVVNPSSEPGDAEVRLPEPEAFEDALSGERFEGDAPLVVPMRARACRMLVRAIPPRAVERRPSARPSARAPRRKRG